MYQQQMSHGDPREVQALRPKRRKISVACGLCQYRKSKCDGQRPVCGQCVSRSVNGHSCTYRDSGINVSSQQQALTTPGRELRGNINPNVRCSTFSPDTSSNAGPQLPQACSTSKARTESGSTWTSQQDQLGGDRGADTESRDLIAHKPNLVPLNKAPVLQPKAEGNNSDTDGNADAMGCVDDWGLKAGLLGASSGARFLQQVQQVVHVTESPTRDSLSGNESCTLKALNSSAGKREEFPSSAFVLPTRQISDRLLKIYWEYSHPIIPCLDQTQFERQYELLWKASEEEFPDEKIFHCILNLVFAIGCRLDKKGSPTNQSKSADVFFARARSLTNFELLEIGQFSLIQAFLLMGLYLQSTNMPRQCLQSVGMAIWIAQDIGLQRPETITSLKIRTERNLASRIWHCCILLDRVAAMAFGRPARISQATASAATPFELVDDGVFSPLAASSSILCPRIEFLAEYGKLHYILGDILAALYTNSDKNPISNLKPRSFITDLSAFIQYDERLDSWKMALSTHLRVNTYSSTNLGIEVFHRQANNLHLRYLYIRLLLLRVSFTCDPSLLRPLPYDAPAHLQLKNATTMRTIWLCVQTATQIIDYICGLLFDERLQRTLPSWWLNITYIHGAASVVVAAQCFVDQLDEKLVSTLSPSLLKSYRILQSYETTTPSARRCQSALEAAYLNVMQRDVGKDNHVPSSALDGKTASSRPEFSHDNNGYMDAAPNGMQNANSDKFDFEWLNKMFEYEDSLSGV